MGTERGPGKHKKDWASQGSLGTTMGPGDPNRAPEKQRGPRTTKGLLDHNGAPGILMSTWDHNGACNYNGAQEPQLDNGIIMGHRYHNGAWGSPWALRFTIEPGNHNDAQGPY